MQVYLTEYEFREANVMLVGCLGFMAYQPLWVI